MPAVSYQESVHGKLVASGNTRAAVCSDCHGNHDIRRPSDPASPVFRANIPKTCGECHATEAAIFDNSIHGKAVAEGNDPRSRLYRLPRRPHHQGRQRQQFVEVSLRNQGDLACGQCHNNVRDDRGVSAFRAAAPTPINSAITAWRTPMGSNKHRKSAHPATARTTSFHRRIQRSTINPANLARTCGQCHPGANANFAKGKIHLDPAAAAQADFGSKVVEWVRKLYILMIISVVGFMFLHNLMIFVRKLIDRRKHCGSSRQRTQGGGAHDQESAHSALPAVCLVLHAGPDRLRPQVPGCGDSLPLRE